MILMQIEKVNGDCQIPGFKDHFTLTSASFGIVREMDSKQKAGTQDLTFGVATLEDLSIAKSMDKASDQLATFAMRGATLGTVDIKFVQTTSDDANEPINHIFLWIKLDTAFCKTWNMSGSEDGRPEEELTLFYNKIAFKWYFNDPTGPNEKIGAKNSSSGFAWDHVTNRLWANGTSTLPPAEQAWVK